LSSTETEPKDLASIDWSVIVDKVRKYCTSEAVKESLKLEPLANAFLAGAAMTSVKNAEHLLSKGQRPFMESLDLSSVWLQRLSKGATLQPLEFKDVHHFCAETLALKSILTDCEVEEFQHAADDLFNAEEPLSAIDQILTSDGGIRTDASETLYKLFNEKNKLARDIAKILDRLVHEHGLSTVLQDKYVTTREGRWVLPVKSGMQGKFEGIIHASSQSKQTVFMEPQEVVKTNNRLREIEQEIEDEIEALLKALSSYFGERVEEILQAQEILFTFDELFAKAKLSLEIGGNIVNFSDNAIELRDVKHPLLVLDQNTEVTPNTVKMSSEQKVLLLSGPNAGGKTVLLKAIGLAAQMARCGLPICADEASSLPFFRQIQVGVGDSQSVDEHLSTFAAHLRVLNEASQLSGSDSLILIDEICGSTDPEEGSALARSFLEAYCKNSVFGVITSHLGPLKRGWKPEQGLINGSLEYDSESGSPSYRLLMGVPGQSLAIQTAKRVGVSKDIVDRAMSHLSPEMRRYQENLEEVSLMKDHLVNMKKELQQQSEDLKKEKSKYHALLSKFEAERDKMVQIALNRAEKKIDKLVEKSKVDDLFKKHSAAESVKQKLPEVVKASSTKPKRLSDIKTAEEFAKHFPAGSKVYSNTIGRDAVVQGEPNGKGEVLILSNSMRLSVPWRDLTSPKTSQNPTKEIMQKNNRFVGRDHFTDNSLDVRGMTVADALDHLEDKLDQATAQSGERIKIVHGHGTESLKKAVRSYLSRSVYVKKWQSGSGSTGGDGITWVELADS
jgi:DNA mismatch repair protein MutS2